MKTNIIFINTFYNKKKSLNCAPQTPGISLLLSSNIPTLQQNVVTIHQTTPCIA